MAGSGTKDHNKEYLTPIEVARLFRVDPKTVTRWAKDGKLPYIRTLGGHRRYPEASIRKLLGESETAAVEQDEVVEP